MAQPMARKLFLALLALFVLVGAGALLGLEGWAAPAFIALFVVALWATVAAFLRGRRG